MKNLYTKLILLVLLIPSLGFTQPYSSNLTSGNDFDSPQFAGTLECGSAVNPFVNCGFESGDFTGWVTADLTTPFVPVQVGVGGLDIGFGFFVSAPTEGTMAALSGFDGDGPGRIEIAQDIVVPANAGDLTFDYRGAWDLTFGATVARTFDVEIQPSGGGAALQATTFLTAAPGETAVDSGSQSGVVDMAAYSNQAVRVAFVLNVPEANTGPAFFQLDNVAVQGSPNAAPTASFTYSCNFLSCDFDGSGSSDSDGSITNYSWSFGTSGVTANNVFNQAGTYDVTLTVTDDGGAVDFTTQSITVSGNIAPIASFTYECNSLNCSFDASGSSDADGTIVDYAWSFGGSGATVDHRFTFAGPQSVTLTVTDNGGAIDSTTSVVNVEPIRVPMLSNIGTLIVFFALLLFGYRNINRKVKA